MKYIAAASALALLLAFGPPAATGAPCATLNLTVTPAPPATVAPGGPLTFTASLTNCSNAFEALKVTYVVTGPGFDDSFSIRFGLRAGQSLHASFTVPAPPILGVYTITATVSSGGATLSAASATFVVQ